MSNEKTTEQPKPSQKRQGNPFCINIFPADTTGCDFYRNFCPRETIEHCVGNIMFNTCRKFLVDDNFFRGINVNILQRQVNNAQCEYYLKYIIPMSRKCGSWIVYNIDDCIFKDDIPRYNKAWEVYQDEQYMQNVYKMLNASDFVLVTTEELGKYYTKRFSVSDDAIIVIPNYLPRWWIEHCYDHERSVRNFEKNKARPRIGLIGAPSHYDVNNKKLDNDITPILPYIKKTLKDYRWVVFGSKIPELEEYIAKGDIEFHGGIDILHYPDRVSKLNLQYVVAPLQDNTFNRCKSNIKLTESWAMGIGCAAQDICSYNKYTKDVFGDCESLDAILKRDLKDESTFGEKIAENFKKMDDWWLESHLDSWLKLYRLRQKPLLYNYDSKIAQQRQQQQKKSSDGGIEAPKIVIPDLSDMKAENDSEREGK